MLKSIKKFVPAGSKSEKFIFLGLPGSGKTTYFVLMANMLQQVANGTKKFRFKFLPAESTGSNAGGCENADALSGFAESTAKDFVSRNIDRIENEGHWPFKTELQNPVGYRFALEKSMCRSTFKFRTVISYFDFPGETFENFFGGDNRKQSAHKQLSQPKSIGNSVEGDVSRSSGQDVHIDSASTINSPQNDDNVMFLRNHFKASDGVFLVIDAEQMFNKIKAHDIDKMLSRLFDSVKDKKIAIIFSKVDLFFEMDKLKEEKTLCEIFRDTYRDAYAHLEIKAGKCKFFKVKAFSRIDVPEDGSDPKPPKDIEYDSSLLEPVQWMTGFSIP